MTDKLEEGKKPEHNMGPGWMLKGDPELAAKVEKAKKKYKEFKKNVGKKVDEEVEQIDELKKSTLASYAKKATNSMDTHAYHAYRHQDEGDYDKKEKRKQGISKAVDRLAKEEYEHIDESVFADKDQAQSVASKLETKHKDGNYSVVADKGKHRVVHAYYSDSRVKKDIAKLNEEAERIDEATTPYYNKPSFLKRMGSAAKQERLAREKKEREANQVKEAKDGLEGACWKGYTAVGMKMKNGKKVPNCVPVKEDNTQETNSNEEIQMSEQQNTMSFKAFLEEGLTEGAWPGTPEYKAKFPETSRGKVGEKKAGAKGTQTVTGTGVKHERDYEKAEKEGDAPESTEKRGRGRPKGSASGARQKGSAPKSQDGVDYTGYALHLPGRR